MSDRDKALRLAEALDEMSRRGLRLTPEAPDFCAEAAATIRALLDERVKVKPLQWEDYPADDGPVISKAKCLYGTYFIVDDTDDFTGLYLELVSHDDARWWQHVRSTCEVLMENVHDDDLTPIKAAAQTDYERRILSALETAPDGQDMEGK